VLAPFLQIYFLFCPKFQANELETTENPTLSTGGINTAIKGTIDRAEGSFCETGLNVLHGISLTLFQL